MKLTETWLRQHLDTSCSVEELADTLTHLGLEVESLQQTGAELAPFLIAEVLTAEPHPNADKLKLCQVTDGKKQYQVVCGAPNVQTGMKAVLAPLGVTIPRTGKILTAGEIRGKKSEAMLCSSYELNLGDDHDGIIALPDTAKVGLSFQNYLGQQDVLLEIKLTPNRGDCLGVRGIARDLAASGKGKLLPLLSVYQNLIPEIKNLLTADLAFSKKPDFLSPINWQIQPEVLTDCPHATGRYLKNVTNRISPEWLSHALTSVGMKSISLLVDLTNYLSQDLARPLHVFSSKALTDKNLIMRRAKQGEKLLALDEITYDLTPEMLVIANDHGVLSLAGIMGGLNSGTGLNDKAVFLEAAYFNPMTIAQTGQKLNILSDARYRFERGVDPASTLVGLNLASAAMLALAGGEVSEITEAGNRPPLPKAISFSPNLWQSHGGADITPKLGKKMLEDLGCVIKEENENWQVTPPSWRHDITNKFCLITEGLRLYGFDKIQSCDLPTLTTLPTHAITETDRRILLMRRALALRGYYETITFAFTEQKLAELTAGLATAVSDNNNSAINSPTEAKLIRLRNPIHSDYTTMRPSILCNLLLAAKQNQARQVTTLNLFESGLVFFGPNPEQQIPMIAGLRYGNPYPFHWQSKQQRLDLWAIKSDLYAALDAITAPISSLHVAMRDAKTKIPNHYHPKQSAVIKLGMNIVGYFGALHPAIMQYLDLSSEFFGFEIFVEKLPNSKYAITSDESKTTKSRAKPALILNDYPKVMRDFAFEIQSDILANNLITAIEKCDKNLISAVEIFDLYQTEPKSAIKSLAVRVIFTPKEKTLTEQEIKNLSDKIIAAVISQTGGKLRHSSN